MLATLGLAMLAVALYYQYALGDEPCQAPALFLRGADSPYIRDEQLPEIARRFPQSRMQTVPDAGHWLHIDQPSAVHSAIEQYLVGW